MSEWLTPASRILLYRIRKEGSVMRSRTFSRERESSASKLSITIYPKPDVSLIMVRSNSYAINFSPSDMLRTLMKPDMKLLRP